jgi:hypothetical protein
MANAALATVDGPKNRPYVRRPKLRESRYPELPNFRDFAMTVDRDFLRLAGRLQSKHGEAWASEAGWRKMIAEDSGHMPGPSTVPKAVRRLAKHGLVLYRNLRKGEVMPDGSLSRKGTSLYYTPVGRHQKRALKSLAEHRAERDPYRVLRLKDAQKEMAKEKAKLFAVPRVMTEEDRARKVAEDLRRARELGLYDEEKRGKPPPD